MQKGPPLNGKNYEVVNVIPRFTRRWWLHSLQSLAVSHLEHDTRDIWKEKSRNFHLNAQCYLMQN